MCSIIMRSFAERMGWDWPRDVAYVERGSFGSRVRPITSRRVTWADVHAKRRARQARILAERTAPAERRTVPAYVWVFYVPGMIYGGWWCYVVTRLRQIAITFRTYRRDLALSIMRAAPCGMLPLVECFSAWMPQFAERHPRPPGVEDPRRSGSLVGWLSGTSRFTRERPVEIDRCYRET